MYEHRLSHATWTTPSTSTQNNGGCVAIAFGVEQITGVRDSTRPDRGAHVVSRPNFAAFLRDVQAGCFDI